MDQSPLAWLQALEQVNDPRPGVAVKEGLPDIVYLVTYAQYQAFVEAEDGFDHLAWWNGMPKDYQCQRLDQQRTILLNNPRNSISWYHSVAFARWINHRLHGLELPHPSGAGVLRVGGKGSYDCLPSGNGSGLLRTGRKHASILGAQ